MSSTVPTRSSRHSTPTAAGVGSGPKERRLRYRVSVYALSQVGVPNSDVAIQKAWRFLIETQTENGSWIVNGTKTATKDKPHPFSSFWGSTWALLGLSHSLPPTKPNKARPFLAGHDAPALGRLAPETPDGSWDGEQSVEREPPQVRLRD